MLKFHYVKWKNFLSTGSKYSTVTLDSHKKTLFVGINGSGKSTILDALSFGLFGKSFRRINKPNLVNSVNKGDCVVELEFTTTHNGNRYKIVRGISPSKFLIFCNGRQLHQESNVKDQQEYLEKFILRMNSKSFNQIVALGSASYVPFMQLSPADRRSVIEELLDIEVFSAMSATAKERFAENRDQLLKTKLEIDAKEEKIDILNKNMKELESYNETKLNEMRADYKKCLDEKNDLNKEIADLENDKTEKKKKIKTSLSDLRRKHSDMISLRSVKKSKLHQHKKDIKFFKDNDCCPTCEQHLETTHRDEMIKKSGKKALAVQDKIKSVDTLINECIADIENVETIEAEISSIEVDIGKKNIRIEELDRKMKELTEKGIDLRDSDILLSNANKELSKTEKERTDLLEKRRLLSEEKQMIDIAISLLKDGGIKSKIIKQYVPLMNSLINNYLATMNFPVDFSLDENFRETIKSRHIDEFSYENFSEGEKFRINLSILLAWRAIAKVKNSVNCNILFFDEIFDSSLDEDGIDAFMKIMSGLEDTSNVFVISHKTDKLIDKFERVCTFKKKGNFSIYTESCA